MSRHPDAELFPHASGLAKNTVDKHQKQEPLVLYSGWFCPFVQRVWLALEERNIPYQYVEVNPYDKPESLLKLNPRGLVPTLAHDKKALYESTVLLEYLEEAFPDHSPKLLPKDPHARAISRIWTDFVTSRIIPSFHRFLQHQPDETRYSLEDARSEFHGHLKTFAEALDKEGPYFFGKEPTLVDVVLAPWVVRLWIFDHFKGGLNLPEEGEAWARWRKWQSAIESRESVKVTTSEREHSIPLYKRYADNTAQSELAKATRQGRGVP